jgi:hypothetical protein
MPWNWVKRKARAVVIPKRSSEARSAQDRARKSQVEANEALQEMREHSARARHEREKNHFAPLIWENLGRHKE